MLPAAGGTRIYIDRIQHAATHVELFSMRYTSLLRTRGQKNNTTPRMTSHNGGADSAFFGTRIHRYRAYLSDNDGLRQRELPMFSPIPQITIAVKSILFSGHNFK